MIEKVCVLKEQVLKTLNIYYESNLTLKECKMFFLVS